MILRKYMSLLGIGSAQIDLILPKAVYCPGERIYGYYQIKGGTIEQKIRRVDCELVLTDNGKGSEEVIDSTTILTAQLIKTDELNQLPFSFTLPKSIPTTTKSISYHFRTRLTFDAGVESKDTDFIQIVPLTETINKTKM